MSDPISVGDVWQADHGGWYYRTEDDGMSGPFSTQEEANSEYGRYMHYVNTGVEVSPEEWPALQRTMQ